MTQIQYRLYEMTEPYVAELVQPKIALKTPQPEPPLLSVLGLQHYKMLEARNKTEKAIGDLHSRARRSW
jgi:hypothetical protein